MRKILFVSILMTGCLISQAQLADSIKAQLIGDWTRAKAYTKEYLDVVPKDKYSFKAQDSIRSFAQQMLHLAQANINLGTNGVGKPPIWMGASLENSKTAQSADSVMYYVMTSYDYVIDGVKNMDPNKLLEVAGRGRFMLTRFGWLTKAFEHQTHHRGQSTIYIRLMGIKPPNERLF
ncbi:MAG TPA: DinB family protein [Flavitalea sp.]|nr:DinB family protein [Flavitalea sp.]